MLEEFEIIKTNATALSGQRKKNKALFSEYYIPEDGIEYSLFQMKANRWKKTLTASVETILTNKETGESINGCFYVTVDEKWQVKDMGFMKEMLIPIANYATMVE